MDLRTAMSFLAATRLSTIIKATLILYLFIGYLFVNSRPSRARDDCEHPATSGGSFAILGSSYWKLHNV